MKTAGEVAPLKVFHSWIDTACGYTTYGASNDCAATTGDLGLRFHHPDIRLDKHVDSHSRIRLDSRQVMVIRDGLLPVFSIYSI